MKTERYFIISYYHEKGRGSLSMTTNGCYPNDKITQNQIRENGKIEGQILLDNIIELTASDYNDWIN